jgi:hypothetical protein
MPGSRMRAGTRGQGSPGAATSLWPPAAYSAASANPEQAAFPAAVQEHARCVQACEHRVAWQHTCVCLKFSRTRGQRSALVLENEDRHVAAPICPLIPIHSPWYNLETTSRGRPLGKTPGAMNAQWYETPRGPATHNGPSGQLATGATLEVAPLVCAKAVCSYRRPWPHPVMALHSPPTLPCDYSPFATALHLTRPRWHWPPPEDLHGQMPVSAHCVDQAMQPHQLDHRSPLRRGHPSSRFFSTCSCALNTSRAPG